MKISGAHVLVTGGSRGLGLAMARGFAGAGATVTVVARTASDLERAAADIGGNALVSDLTDRAQTSGLLDRAAAQAGAAVDVLVLNAGIDANGPFVEASAEELQRLWQVNVAAPAELLRSAWPTMARQGGGHVVAISSLSAQVAMPGLAAYSASKAALSQLILGLRRELRRDGIRTTLVEIGQARTDMYTELRNYPPAALAFDRFTRMGLLRELGPDEVAKVAVRAVRRDRAFVVRPRRARLQTLLAHAPQRIADRLLPGS